jgi:hypothetical protein
VEENLALANAKFQTKRYTHLGSSVDNAKSLARRVAGKMDDAGQRYDEKAEKLDTPVKIKVPFIGIKIKEPRPSERAKARKLRNFARSFKDLARKARAISR